MFLAKNATEMLQVVGRGLSALTEAQLEMPLDKSLQCSSWGSRPLTQAQVTGPHTKFMHSPVCAIPGTCMSSLVLHQFVVGTVCCSRSGPSVLGAR